jgi:hypothetical protein
MKRYFIALTCLLWLPAVAPAQSVEFADFRIISQRNIFNLNRVPPRGSRAPAPAPAFVDAFSLVGTMTYDKGLIAFFDGTRPEYQKAIQPTNTIGGYKLVAVLPSSVRLETRGAQFEMKLGMQLRRDETSARLYGDGFGATTYDNASAGGTNAVPATATDSAAAAPSGPTPEASEILKRLMQKREQELK